MSYRVTLRPSDHAFDVEPSETLLEAGLRAGLNLEHGCANGGCGECRARLVEGRLKAIRHFDYRFSDAEKQHGWFLTCCNGAASDLVVDAHEVGSAAEIPPQDVLAKVSRVERLQDDVMQLTVRTPRSGGLQFLAGQGVQLQFDGIPAQTLAIASCPCDAVQLRFHLRRHAGDVFSDFVFGKLRKGDALRLLGPRGDFTLDETSCRPLVFIAWESGFAAVASLIDHAIQKDEARSIDLYWLSSIARGHYLSNYCRAWHDVLDDFRCHSIDLQPAGEDRIDELIERVVRVHSLLADCDYYLALPNDSVQIAQTLLRAADVPDSQVRTSVLARP